MSVNAKTERKEQSHERILASASRLLRERGIAGAGVADVMKGARLTVGGFYSHFASKEVLIDEALRRTGSELRARLFERIEEKPEADRAEVILKRYLSAAHRDELVAGCPFPSVVGEVATTSTEYRAVLADQVEAMTSALEPHLPGARAASRRTLALGLVALMYGGLSLARAVRGTALSDEVLKACRALGRVALGGEQQKSR